MQGRFIRVGGRVVYVEDPQGAGTPRRQGIKKGALRWRRLTREDQAAEPKPAKSESKKQKGTPASGASNEPKNTTTGEREVQPPQKPPHIVFGAFPEGTVFEVGVYDLALPIVCTTRPNTPPKVVLFEIRNVPAADPLALGPNLWSIPRGTRIRINRASHRRVLAEVI